MRFIFVEKEVEIAYDLLVRLCFVCKRELLTKV
jgi:hypothetical protein